jgi:flagellar biosynthesis GTPase FlhF
MSITQHWFRKPDNNNNNGPIEFVGEINPQRGCGYVFIDTEGRPYEGRCNREQLDAFMNDFRRMGWVYHMRMV